MKKLFALGIAILMLCSANQYTFAQQKAAPLTKAEILKRLKPVPGQRNEQADLVDEIEQRGIAFTLDEATINELKQAGARSFLIMALRSVDPNAPKTVPEPEPVTEPAASAPDRPRLRAREANEEPATPAPPPPVMTEEERAAAKAAALAKLPLIEQARVHAGDYIEELPNFMVTQFVTRSVRLPNAKDWKEEDKLEVDLSYHETKGEKLKLTKLNGKPTTQSYESLGGATSTGEFGSILAALFSPQSRAEFKEIRTETFKGRPATVFDFRIKKAFSSNTITDRSSGRSVTVGYEGTVWIETATGKTLRIETSANDIQRGFPITLAESAVEYDWVSIADLKFLLPVFAEILLGRDAERYYSRNTIELRNYRVFDSDVKIVP